MSFAATSNYLFKTQLFFLLFSFVICPNFFAQTVDQNVVDYVSPKPGSIDNSPQNNIIIKFIGGFERGTTFSPDLIKVSGTQSGKISGELILTDDNKTIIFKPFSAFELGEIINVNVSGLLSTIGSFSEENNFSFSIKNKIIGKKHALKLFADELEISEKEFKQKTSRIEKTANLDSLPPNYPELTIEKLDNPYAGKLFISLFGGFGIPANMIIENDGNPIYYNELLSAGIDFKKQPDGTITYFDTQRGKFYALNSMYDVVDSFYCGNGFETDLHELLVRPDGHSYLLGMDPRIIDMSQIVPGGKMNAEVLGFLIQELDKNKDVVFQWKSLDYIPVTDASPSIDLTAQVIDYVHSNSICIDFDSDIILSSRHLDEITKIDRQSGEIIWRLGGKENEFVFIDDPYQFSHQHDVKRIANGDILFFDNGNLRTPVFSRAVEYRLNEQNFTATLVWQNIPFPYYVTNAMGSARRFPNGNTLIDWVRAGYITEVKPDGTLALKIKYPVEGYSYRVIRDDWQTTLYTTSVDTLDFGEVGVGNISNEMFRIFNNSESPVTITQILHSNNAFNINENFPIVIQPQNNTEIEISFSPSETKVYEDVLNIRSDSETRLFNRQMTVKGKGTAVTAAEGDNSSLKEYNLFQNYPNPFNPSTKISWQLAEKSFVTIKIFDVIGNEVTTLVKKELPAGRYEKRFNPESLSGEYTSGVYFYTIKALSRESGSVFTETKKMIYLK
jgi:Arylsulfotransferase (ASST)/Cep192 domain 4